MKKEISEKQETVRSEGALLPPFDPEILTLSYGNA